MINANDVPSTPVLPTKTWNLPEGSVNELDHKLHRLDDRLLEVICTYEFYLWAIGAIQADGWPEGEERALAGLALTDQWLKKQGDDVYQ